MDFLKPLRSLHGIMHEQFVPIKGRLQSRRKTIKTEEQYPIDFVVTWVNDRDPEWQEKRRKYAGLSLEEGNIEARFRDWDIFRFWFRAVEKYAPWVNKVFLVTCGHVPEWINRTSEKLVIVAHDDYMDAAYLPTFNSIAIELCLCNIQGLEEHFIYFNDDMFLTKPVTPEDFFEGGLPKYAAIAEPLRNYGSFAFFQHQLFSNLGLINREFNIRNCIEEHPEKWFSYLYGKDIKYNIFAYQRSFLPGMVFTHLLAPYRKSTLKKVWDAIPERLDWSCKHKFREPLDLMHQIFQLWEICQGDFVPVTKTYYGGLPAGIFREALEAVEEERYICVCLNDGETISETEFQDLKGKCYVTLNRKFPEKSGFEL